MSLDVVSLFTNVPIELTIKSIEKRWHHISENISILYNEFLTGIRLVLDSTYFVFNDSIYKQTFVTPLGSPLSSVPTDLILQDLKEVAISKHLIDLSVYFRYVDDICFAPIKLQFTIEKSNTNTISFLDLFICLNEGRFTLDWYRKPFGKVPQLLFAFNMSQKKNYMTSFIDCFLSSKIYCQPLEIFKPCEYEWQTDSEIVRL
ncbi:hypothetical protein ACFW04_014247 [Cataglyphis niger]